ncbi:hypothetical protein FRB90_000697 [Tulasnella sp. 427]|nr:hypothetical protein FRB90_000697 [Tulasnella sp. 427]
MIHGLPKRPVTTIPPVTRTPSSSSAQARSQIHAAHATQAHHLPPPPPNTTVPLSNVLTSSSEVFLSQISLPDQPTIHYRQFGPIDGVPNPHQAVELVRRSIIREWDTKGILDTYLTVVRADKHSVSLWVFVVSSEGAAPGGFSLETLQFEEMHTFLDAVRDRLIDKITQQQQARPRKANESPILRLNHGFILSQRSPEPGWGKDWNAEEDCHWKKLVHCYLQVSLLPTRLLIQPVFSKLPLKYLPNDASAGAPVVLLPYGAPAHYLGPYVGSTREHEISFKDSLMGLGCREWNSDGFVVCWITVRNGATAQHTPANAPGQSGDERGLMVVWPRALCLLSQSPGRAPLTTLPSVSSSVCPPVSPPRPTAASGANGEASVEGQSSKAPPCPTADVPSHTQTSLFDALKAMTISGDPKGLGSGFEPVASEMNSYVDWILRERERERERAAKEKEREKLRREGDRHSQPATGLGRPAIVRPSASQPNLGVPAMAARTTGPSTASLLRQHGSASNPQGYYPSPPELSSPAAPGPDPARLSAEVSSQLSEYQSGPSNDKLEFPPNTNLSNAVELAETQDENQESEVNQARNGSVDMDVEMEIGMGDVTEDDFNFWDEPSMEPAIPGIVQDAGLVPSAPTLDPIVTVEEPTSSSMAHQNDSIPAIQLEASSQSEAPPGLDPAKASETASSNPLLPLSPAQTPPLIVEFPASPASESSSSDSSYASSEDAEQSAIPPEFPYRVKEYVHHEYLPLPVTTTSIITDMKYSVPGGKFCFPPSNVASPAARSVDLEKPEDPPIPTNAFIRSLPVLESSAPSTLPLPIQKIAERLFNSKPPVSREVDALEKQRSKRRAESRKQRERPIRDGEFEIWHSKKFVDRFLSNTDPRVKQVRRLRGMKRNLEWSPYPFLRTEKDGDARSNWKNWADFTEILPSEKAVLLQQEDSSDEETITGDEEEVVTPLEAPSGCNDSEDIVDASVDDKVDPPKTPISQSSTALVPHGSTLLQTLFHPNHVYPLAMVRTAALVPQPTAPVPVPISVPTPVSPAAHFIQGGEAALMVEGAADVVTREVIENPSWATAYRAAFGWTMTEPVWALEADYLADLVAKVPMVKTRTSLQELATITVPPTYVTNFKSLTQVTSPMVSVGQSKSVIHVSAPAVRFWEKLGLSPLNGKKEVVTFALYEEGLASPERLTALSSWMKDVARLYSLRGLGTCQVGSDDTPYIDGLIPFKWDAVKKTLASFILTSPADAEHIVIYVVTDAANALIGSKEFRQLSAVIANVQSAVPHLDGRILFHFVPKALVYHPGSQSSSRALGLNRFVVSLYNRLPKKVSRIVPRHLFKRPMLRSDRFLPAPAFVLARNSPKFSFLLVDWPPPSDDVADRHTFLHIGYQLSDSKEWLFLAGVDEHGEGHNFKVWYVGPCESEDEVYDKVARRVMAFAWDFAGKARVEWSAVIGRSGTMCEPELIAWEKCLHREVISQDVAIHVTIVCVEQSNPFSVLAMTDLTKATATLVSNSTLHKAAFHDSSSTSYIVQSFYRMALLPSDHHFVDTAALAINPETEIIPSPLGQYGAAPRLPQISLLPLASAFVFHCPSAAERTNTSAIGSEASQQSVSTYRVHVLKTVGSPTSSHRKPLHIQLQDISKNYVALSALARERWSIVSFGGLPFHLAAVEIMRRVLAYAHDS